MFKLCSNYLKRWSSNGCQGNNIEGKITECWLVNEESIFLDFALWRRQNYSLTIGRLVA